MSNDLEAIEISLSEAKAKIALKNALDRLSDDINFQQVIINNYFVNEASRLVLLKASPAMQSNEDQQAIIKAIDAIGHFRQYLHSIIQIGNMAEKAIKDDEETKEEILREAL